MSCAGGLGRVHAHSVTKLITVTKTNLVTLEPATRTIKTRSILERYYEFSIAIARTIQL